MDTVFILWHHHRIEDDTDSKLIGVYSSEVDARRAQQRLAEKPGFKDAPEGFEVEECKLGQDGWTEGYISWTEAMDPK